MANIQYYRSVGWDTTLADLGTDEKGLVINGLKISGSGAPAATVGKFEPACIIQNIFDGSSWQNEGTTAAPSWYLI